MYCSKILLRNTRPHALIAKNLCFFSTSPSYLSKKSACKLSNQRIMTSMLKSNWDEALILIEQARVLNHASDKATGLLEAVTYQLGYNRGDLVKKALRDISNQNEENDVTEAYLESLIQMIVKLENDKLYKMDKKELKRILEIMQDALE